MANRVSAKPFATHECNWSDDPSLCERYCNVYSNPEKFGLKLLKSHSDNSQAYQFHIALLLQDKQGRKWFVSDSGCSCPTPFENVKGTQDMTPLEGHEQEYKDLVYRIEHPKYWD